MEVKNAVMPNEEQLKGFNDQEEDKPIFRGKRGGKLNATVVQKLVRDIRIKHFLTPTII